MSMSSVASPEMVAEAMVTVNGGFQPAPIILGNIVTAGTTTVTTTSVSSKINLSYIFSDWQNNARLTLLVEAITFISFKVLRSHET